MKRFGYGRVSSLDQDLSIQRAALKAARCDLIREEKVSGKSRNGRTELQILIDFIGADDVLVVTKLDRLGRNLRDILNVVEEISEKGAKLQVLQSSAIDPTNPMGRMMLAVFGAVSELERDMIAERQREGIAVARKRGVYRGGKVRFDRRTIRDMHASGKRVCDIARELGCSADTVGRALRGSCAASPSASAA